MRIQTFKDITKAGSCLQNPKFEPARGSLLPECWILEIGPVIPCVRGGSWAKVPRGIPVANLIRIPSLTWRLCTWERQCYSFLHLC
jgi:hypothetical protein